MIYLISFYNKIIELLPPDKREAIMISWLKVMGSPIEYMRNKLFNDYKTGAIYDEWTAGTYSVGDLVTYKKVIYESKEDGNTDTPPSSKWAVYQNIFIGSDDRVKYNGQKIILEYALNQYYSTTFRQPNLISDIYIETLGYTLQGILIGKTEPYSSSIGETTSSGFIGSNTPFLQDFNFKIWFPLATFTSTNEQEIRNFVNKIIPASLNYSIDTY